MITFGKLYFNPQINCIEKHFGFGLSMYWNNNDTARYVSFDIMFLNLSMNFVFGEKK